MTSDPPPLEVSYRWCPNDVVPCTEVRLQIGSIFLLIEPSLIDGAYIEIGEEGGREGVCGMRFDRWELDRLIAELQRARSGCFLREYPSEPQQMPAIDGQTLLTALIDHVRRQGLVTR